MFNYSRNVNRTKKIITTTTKTVFDKHSFKTQVDRNRVLAGVLMHEKYAL